MARRQRSGTAFTDKSGRIVSRVSAVENRLQTIAPVADARRQGFRRVREHGPMVVPVRTAGQIPHRQMIRCTSGEYDASSSVLDPERSRLVALRKLGSHRRDPGVRSVDHDTGVRRPAAARRRELPAALVCRTQLVSIAQEMAEIEPE